MSDGKNKRLYLFGLLGLGAAVALSLEHGLADNLYQVGATQHMDDTSTIRIEKTELSQFSQAGSYLAARYARRQNDVETASLYYSHALTYDPYDPSLMKQAIRAHLIAGDIEDAAQIASNLNDLQEGNQLTHLILYVEALKQEDYKKAAEYLAMIDPYGLFSIMKPVLEAWMDVAQSGEAADIQMSEQIRSLHVFEPFVALQAAFINDLAGGEQKAAEYYRDSSVDIEGMSYRHMLAIVNHFLRHKQEDKARGFYKIYLEANPLSLLTHGASYEEMLQDLPPEKRQERFVNDVAEGVAEQLFAIAGMLYNEGVTTETLIYLRLALHLRPDLNDGLLMLGNIMEEEEKVDEALATYDQIKTEGPLYRRAQIRKAFIYSQQEMLDASLNTLNALQKKFPDNTDIYVTLGDIYRKASKFDDAVEAYTNALNKQDIEEHHWPILFARGISYERDGDWDMAEKDFEKALSLYPEQPDVLNYLGYSWLVKGVNIDKAKSLLEQAVAERPKDAHIIDSMGWALYLLGDYQQALVYLEQAADLMPNDPVVNDHLGDALWRAGRKTEAKFQWERALYYGPEDKERDKIEKKLKHGLSLEEAKNVSPRMPNTDEKLQ